LIEVVEAELDVLFPNLRNFDRQKRVISRGAVFKPWKGSCAGLTKRRRREQHEVVGLAFYVLTSASVN